MRQSIKTFPVTGRTKAEQLEFLQATVTGCRNCPNLADTRTQTVFGDGDPDARLMFVGEAPGAAEDATGRPFVGKAGKLLTRMLQNMGLTRDEVWIGNILKCRPDVPLGETNRPPTNVEIRECLPYLYAQIGIIQPMVIVAMGNTAMDGLLRHLTEYKRGFVYEFDGIPVVTTYHPAYVLRNPTEQVRANFWAHLLSALEMTGAKITQEMIECMPTVRDLG